MMLDFIFTRSLHPIKVHLHHGVLVLGVCVQGVKSEDSSNQRRRTKNEEQ